MAKTLTLDRLDAVLDKLATVITEHDNGDAFVGLYVTVEEERERVDAQNRVKARIVDRHREAQFS